MLLTNEIDPISLLAILNSAHLTKTTGMYEKPYKGRGGTNHDETLSSHMDSKSLSPTHVMYNMHTVLLLPRPAVQFLC